MAVTQIIGPRIAPLWADPVEWTSTRAYEPFTFVTYQGDSYCSRQDTPIGIQITNDDYWVKVSDYNAQAVALQRSMTQTIETAETNMAGTIQTGKNDITKAINDAETSMQQSVADVNEVKSEFQTQLNQVTTNKNDIATLQDKTVHNILHLGNSYTTGYATWIRPYAISDGTAFAFDNHYAIGWSACGFAAYPNHDYNFYDELTNWYNNNKAAAQTITDIAINSAVGDSYAYKKLSNYGTLAFTCINNILDFVKKNFPAVRRVMVFLCDSLYNKPRQYYDEDIYVSVETLQELYSYFNASLNFLNTSNNDYDFSIEFCGWPGWNLIDTEYMNQNDNTHPNQSGYIALARNWLRAYYGTLQYSPLILSETLDCSAFATNTNMILRYTGMPDSIVIDECIYGANDAAIVSPNNWVTIEPTAENSIIPLLFKNNATFIMNCNSGSNPTTQMRFYASSSSSSYARLLLRANTFTNSVWDQNSYRTHNIPIGL